MQMRSDRGWYTVVALDPVEMFLVAVKMAAATLSSRVYEEMMPYCFEGMGLKKSQYSAVGNCGYTGWAKIAQLVVRAG